MAKQDIRRYADRRQYLIHAVHKRRKKIRQMAVEYKGGKCEQCGYDRCVEALEFHHFDSSKKILIYRSADIQEVGDKWWKS